MKMLVEENDLEGYLEAFIVLNALRGGGVDNWEGYDSSMEGAGVGAEVEEIMQQYRKENP